MRWRLLLPRTLRAIALAAAVASGTVDLAHAQGVDVNVEIRLTPGLARDLERTLQHATGMAGDVAGDVVRSVLRDLDPWLRASNAAGLAVQDRDFRIERTDRSTRTLALGPTGSLELRTISGDITVTAGSGADVVLEVVRQSRGRTEADAALGLREVPWTVDHRGERALVETAAPRGRTPYHVNTTYSVTAPAGTRITATTISGNVNVKNIKGDVSVEIKSGNVNVAGAGRIPQARSISGNVTLTDISSDGLVNAGTISGNVVLERVRTSRLVVEIVSGDIRATDVAAQGAQLTSLSGTVDYSGPLARSGRYELYSHSGSVRFVTDGAVGFELQANTFSGRITSDPAFSLQSTNLSRGTLRATIGDGSAVVVARTFSGNVAIRRK